VLHAVLKRAEALEPAIRAPVACDALGEAPKKVPREADSRSHLMAGRSAYGNYGSLSAAGSFDPSGSSTRRRK
jgi:hypothetical protein